MKIKEADRGAIKIKRQLMVYQLIVCWVCTLRFCKITQVYKIKFFCKKFDVILRSERSYI